MDKITFITTKSDTSTNLYRLDDLNVYKYNRPIKSHPIITWSIKDKLPDDELVLSMVEVVKNGKTYMINYVDCVKTDKTVTDETIKRIIALTDGRLKEPNVNFRIKQVDDKIFEVGIY